MSERGKIVIVIAVLAALLVATPFANSFVVLLVTQALVFAILAMSLDILLGYTGLPSLGQAAYLGVGAYLTAILASQYEFGLGWSFWVVLLLGIGIGALTAAFFGLFAIRATGVYFLMITLALGQCVWGLVYRWNSLTGGDNGINMPGRPEFGIDLADDLTFFYLVFGFFVATLAILYLLVKSPFGRSLVGIRESELRMRILGYNTWLHKYIAFIIAGGFGGLAGIPERAGEPRGCHPDHLGRRAAHGGSRRAGHARRRGDRRGRGGLSARISQHAGAVVAVRAGRRLCAYDSVSPGRLDGHPGANSPAPHAVGDR
jgi:branched-chain amino acid transport system permease protein